MKHLWLTDPANNYNYDEVSRYTNACCCVCYLVDRAKNLFWWKAVKCFFLFFQFFAEKCLFNSWKLPFDIWFLLYPFHLKQKCVHSLYFRWRQHKSNNHFDCIVNEMFVYRNLLIYSQWHFIDEVPIYCPEWTNQQLLIDWMCNFFFLLFSFVHSLLQSCLLLLLWVVSVFMSCAYH